MDAGYDVINVSPIEMDPKHEKIYLLRMPKDVDLNEISSLPMERLFSASGESSQVVKNKLQAQLETTRDNEKKIFRAITYDSIAGNSEVGPAFEGVVSITKEVVPIDTSGKVLVKVGLPNSHVRHLPISYAKKAQMPAVKAYLDNVCGKGDNTMTSASAASPGKGSKKRKVAETEKKNSTAKKGTKEKYPKSKKSKK